MTKMMTLMKTMISMKEMVKDGIIACETKCPIRIQKI